MKLALTADWHVGQDLPEDEKQLRAFVKECAAADVDAVLIAGDIFHKSNCATSKWCTGAVQRVALDAIRDLSSECPVIMTVGNHDYAGVGSEDCLRCFDGMPNVSVLRSFLGGDCVYQFPTTNVFVLALPWSWDFSRNIEEEFEKLYKLSGVRILMAHCQVRGFRLNTSKVCEGGGWCVTREYLEANVYPCFDKVVFGDFHERQGPYVGAIRHMNFGDEGNAAGFEIYDTDTKESQWIELSAAKRYRTIYLAPGEKKPKKDEAYYDRVIYTGEPERQDVVDLERQGVKVLIESVAQERLTRSEPVAAGTADRPRDCIRLWAGAQTPPLSEDDINSLIETYDEEMADK